MGEELLEKLLNGKKKNMVKINWQLASEIGNQIQFASYIIIDLALDKLKPFRLVTCNCLGTQNIFSIGLPY